MTITKKAPTLEKLIETINLYVTSQGEERKNAQADFEAKKAEVLQKIKAVIEDIRLKGKLHDEKAASIQIELDELILLETQKADELVLCEEPDQVKKIESKLGELNSKRMILEAKLRAFTNTKVGLSRKNERELFKKLLNAYDAIEYTGPSEFDLKQRINSLKTALKEVSDRVEREINHSFF